MRIHETTIFFVKYANDDPMQEPIGVRSGPEAMRNLFEDEGFVEVDAQTYGRVCQLLEEKK